MTFLMRYEWRIDLIQVKNEDINNGHTSLFKATFLETYTPKGSWGRREEEI